MQQPVLFSRGEIVGGAGGGSFDDSTVVGNSRLAEVRVRYGHWVDCVQIGIQQAVGDPVIWLSRNGGTGGIEHTLRLEQGEYLLRVDGYAAERIINGLQLVTNRRATDWLGRCEGDAFSIMAPYGYEICGFHGRCALYVDAIGAVFRPFALPPGTPPIPQPRGIVPVHRVRSTWLSPLATQDAIFVGVVSGVFYYLYPNTVELWLQKLWGLLGL